MPRPSDIKGFTLVESVIACAVLITALLSIGHLGAVSIARIGDARHRTIATALAAAKLEELRTDRTPAAGRDTVDSAGQASPPGPVMTFERRWSVTPITPDAQILTVVVHAIPIDAGREVRMVGGWMAEQ